jgi:hypothetical protein
VPHALSACAESWFKVRRTPRGTTVPAWTSASTVRSCVDSAVSERDAAVLRLAAAASRSWRMAAVRSRAVTASTVPARKSSTTR